MAFGGIIGRVNVRHIFIGKFQNAVELVAASLGRSVHDMLEGEGKAILSQWERIAANNKDATEKIVTDYVFETFCSLYFNKHLSGEKLLELRSYYKHTYRPIAKAARAGNKRLITPSKVSQEEYDAFIDHLWRGQKTNQDSFSQFVANRDIELPDENAIAERTRAAKLYTRLFSEILTLAPRTPGGGRAGCEDLLGVALELMNVSSAEGLDAANLMRSVGGLRDLQEESPRFGAHFYLALSRLWKECGPKYINGKIVLDRNGHLVPFLDAGCQARASKCLAAAYLCCMKDGLSQGGADEATRVSILTEWMRLSPWSESGLNAMLVSEESDLADFASVVVGRQSATDMLAMPIWHLNVEELAKSAIETERGRTSTSGPARRRLVGLLLGLSLGYLSQSTGERPHPSRGSDGRSSNPFILSFLPEKAAQLLIEARTILVDDECVSLLQWADWYVCCAVCLGKGGYASAESRALSIVERLYEELLMGERAEAARQRQQMTMKWTVSTASEVENPVMALISFLEGRELPPFIWLGEAR